MIRRYLLSIPTLFFLTLGTASVWPAPPARAQQIDYFVVNPNNAWEVFEVIDDSSAGGRFVRDRFQYLPDLGRYLVGHTDRGSRGEYVITRVRGRGFVRIRLRVAGNVLAETWTHLPSVDMPRWISHDPSFDNIFILVSKDGRRAAARRLPLGTRP